MSSAVLFHHSPAAWALIAFAALIIGFAKTGLSGFGILAVVIAAAVFPAKESTGIILPMLLFADLFAIFFYRQHVNWPILFRLLPFVVPGILAGFLFMGHISSGQLKPVIGIIVLLMLGLHLLNRRYGDRLIKPNMVFAGLVGFGAGFTTMLANAAGPLMAGYFLTLKLDKTKYVGCTAWYFFLINMFKIPFSAALGLITLPTITFNALFLPVILVGALSGYRLVKVIPQKWFDMFVQVLAFAGAVRLIIP